MLPQAVKRNGGGPTLSDARACWTCDDSAGLGGIRGMGATNVGRAVVQLRRG